MSKSLFSTARLALAAGIVMAGTVSPGQAADWYFTPDLRLGGEFNDNYRLNLDEQNELDGAGIFADLAVEIGTRTPRNDFYIRPRIQTGAYDDSQVNDLREGDYYVNAAWRHTGLKSRIDFRPRWSSVSVLRSELGDVDSDEFVAPDDSTSDSGIALIDGTRDRWELPLDYEYALSTVQSLLAGGSYKDISYDENLDFLRDFTESRLYVGFSQQVTERDWITLTGSYNRYEPDTNLDSDFFQVIAEWERRFDELWNIYLDAGMNLTRTDVQIGNVVDDDYESRPLLRIGMLRVQEQSQIRFELGNDVRGTSDGELRDRITAKLVYDWEFRPRWNFLATLFAYEDTSLFTSGGNDLRDRTYARVRFGLGYALTPAITIGGEYVYTWQDRDNVPGDATSNGVLVQIAYRPQTPRYRR